MLTKFYMRNFIFRCPTTNLNVQGSVDAGEAESKEYVQQTCLACGQVHLVKPVSGELLSERFLPDDDRGE